MSEGPIGSVNPRGFKIAEGHVDIKADVDEPQVIRAAHRTTDIVEDTARRRRRGFFRTLFTPDPQILSALRTGIPSVLGTPVTAAAITLAGVFAAGFVGALLSAFLTAGIAAVFLGLGAFIVSQNNKIAKKLIDGIGKQLKDMLKTVTEPLIFPIILAITRFKVLLKELEDPLGSIFESLATTITPITTGVFEFIRIIAESMSDVMPDFAEILVEIADQLPGLADSIADFFQTFADHKEDVKLMVDALFAFTNWFIRVAAPIILQAGEMLTELREDFQKVRRGVETATAGARAALGGFQRVMQTVALGVIRAIRNLKTWWGGLPSSVRNAVSKILENWKVLPGQMLQVLAHLPANFFSAGTKIMTSLIEGILSELPSLRNVMGDVAAAVLDFLPGSPVRKGPLTVVNQIATNPGGKLADKFIEGFADRWKRWQLPMTPAMATPNVTVTPSIESPAMDVHVYLDGQEITKRVEVTVNRMNRQVKRAVRSGGRRLP